MDSNTPRDVFAAGDGHALPAVGVGVVGVVDGGVEYPVMEIETEAVILNDRVEDVAAVAETVAAADPVHAAVAPDNPSETLEREGLKV